MSKSRLLFLAVILLLGIALVTGLLIEKAQTTAKAVHRGIQSAEANQFLPGQHQRPGMAHGGVGEVQ
jgi:hypothetical protein